MSFEKVRPYFKEKLESLGYTQWVDSFSDLNTPRTQLDQSFVNVGVSFSSAGPNARDIEVSLTYEVSIKLEAFRDPDSKIDEALERAEAIIKKCVSPCEFDTSEDLKQVSFTSGSVIPLSDEENDNVIQLNLSFDVTLTICLC